MAKGPKVRVQTASAKRGSTLRQPPVCPQLTGNANARRKPQGFQDHRSFRWSFSFGRKIRADDGSYLDGACFQVSDGQLFGSSRSKKLDDEPALWPLWGMWLLSNLEGLLFLSTVALLVAALL